MAGREFYRTPRPRWESLHSIQGLVELYRITGDPTYRDAFLHHWASIRRFDLRSTGGFSSGEQASGDPFRDDAIETCCVIAWQAVCLDALRLTGDSTIADDLELATFNAVFGSQHPSGAWCTYNTPLSGNRQPSHIQIAFQVRPGTPHLNCCSVNGPRGYGMVSEWGVMRSDGGLTLNYLGPMRAEIVAGGRNAGRAARRDGLPVGRHGSHSVEPAQPQEFALAVRIPGWSSGTVVEVAGEQVPDVLPGRYLRLSRKWTKGDEIKLQLNMAVRYETGDLEQAGRAALYRGPILLAADSRFAPDNAAPVAAARLGDARRIEVETLGEKAVGLLRPWLAVDVPTVGGQLLRLIDFASSGAATVEGQPLSTYRSWLPAQGLRPPRPVAWRPADGAACGAGPIRFTWRVPAAAGRTTDLGRGHLAFAAVRRCSGAARGDRRIVAGRAGRGLEGARAQKPGFLEKPGFYWKIVTTNQHGQAESIAPYKRLVIDPTQPPMADSRSGRASDQLLAGVSLRGDVQPEYGRLLEAHGWKACAGLKGEANGAVELDGQQGMVTFAVEEFPDRDYGVSIWARVTQMPGARLGQIFSAWSRGMDDPLRVVVQGDRLFARLEAGQFFGTEGCQLETGRWYHVAAVKQAEQLTLYVDGAVRQTARVPAVVASAADRFAIGGNPGLSGRLRIPGRPAGGSTVLRPALSGEEIRALFQAGTGKTSP